MNRIPWVRVAAEGVVIVFSILLAFGIDAWWEESQEGRARDEFARVLLSDLRATRGRLAEEIAAATRYENGIGDLLAAIDTLERVPVDSLQSLARGAFVPLQYSPGIFAFSGGAWSSDVAELESFEVRRALASFEEEYSQFVFAGERFGQVLLGGAATEVVQDMGSVYSLIGSPLERFELSGEAYRATIRDPRTYAVLEVLWSIQRSSLGYLRRMDEAAREAIAALEAML